MDDDQDAFALGSGGFGYKTEAAGLAAAGGEHQKHALVPLELVASLLNQLDLIRV
jgi:hypothetical protein